MFPHPEPFATSVKTKLLGCISERGVVASRVMIIRCGTKLVVNLRSPDKLVNEVRR